jgi:lysine 2,3-aminomutase
MSLQLLRGRDAKSPSRAGQQKPAASTVLQAQNAKQIATIGKPKAKPRLPFPVSEETRAFYRRFYPGTTSAEWNDWHWQFQARVRSLADLEKVFVLSEDEREAVANHSGPLPVGITPYYASLMSRDDPSEPLRRTHIQTRAEAILSPGESDDPLGEDHDSPAPGLVHRYPDRVLFLTTGTCSTYCRYCTRARAVGNPGGEYQLGLKQWDRALAYIEEHTEVRDVLLSGGDPLSIADEKLDYLLTRLRKIKHVEFLRMGSKVPMVLPQRITKNFVKMLKKHHPLWMSIHVTHPREFTPETTEALNRLADAGVPLGSQTVLMKGINDHIDIMKPLMHGLLKRRVKPYYLFAVDPIRGSAPFRTTVQTGLDIVEGLRGFTTGYATPIFAVDAPGGGGKIQLAPDFIVGRDGDNLLVRNFEDKVYSFPDPGGTLGADKNAKAKIAAE